MEKPPVTQQHHPHARSTASGSIPSSSPLSERVSRLQPIRGFALQVVCLPLFPLRAACVPSLSAPPFLSPPYIAKVDRHVPPHHLDRHVTRAFSLPPHLTFPVEARCRAPKKLCALFAAHPAHATAMNAYNNHHGPVALQSRPCSTGYGSCTSSAVTAYGQGG